MANHVVKNSAVQVGRIQQQYKEHIMEIKDIEKAKKLLEKEFQGTQASYRNLQRDFNEKRGIFQTKFCKCYGQHETSVPGVPQWCTSWQ